MRNLWNYFVAENPMSQEAVRAGRRFVRTGGATGKAVNYTILGLIGVLYLWLLAGIVKYRVDMSEGMLFLELTVLTFVVPATLFASISGEREKLTWDALVMTRINPAQIIAGKIIWRLGLALAIMALFFVPMLFGHLAAPSETSGRNFFDWQLSRQFLLFSWTVLLSVATFYTSARTRRAMTTLSVITVSLLAFLALSPFIVMLFGGTADFQNRGGLLAGFGTLLIHLNPFYAVMAVDPGNGNALSVGIDPGLPLIYLIAAAGFTRAAHAALRQLEAPRRTMG
jgi:hypothetical protein